MRTQQNGGNGIQTHGITRLHVDSANQCLQPLSHASTLSPQEKRTRCCLFVQGKMIATLNVGFATNATVFDTAPTQSDISSKVTGAGNSTSSSSTTCKEECAIYQLSCAFKHRCWSRIFLFFGYICIGLVVGKESALCSSILVLSILRFYLHG